LVAGEESLREVCGTNGWRLTDFATMENMKVMSTYLQRKNVYKETWVSPDGRTKNQIDCVLIQARHTPALLDVRSSRGADSMIKMRSRRRINSKNKNSGVKRIKYNIHKLKEKGIK
jgi:hypothetical protein